MPKIAQSGHPDCHVRTKVYKHCHISWAQLADANLTGSVVLGTFDSKFWRVTTHRRLPFLILLSINFAVYAFTQYFS
jgi:hypothetical protein